MAMHLPIAPIAIGVIALIAVAILGVKTSGKGSKAAGEIKRKTPLTKNEQPMFFRLKEAFPEYEVLAQVAFSALLTTKDRPTRNRFDRKVADFVICSKAFEVLAVVELDDSSHNGREKADAERDNLLKRAGYKVLRFKRVPDMAEVQAALKPLQATPAQEPTKRPAPRTTPPA